MKLEQNMDVVLTLIAKEVEIRTTKNEGKRFISLKGINKEIEVPVVWWDPTDEALDVVPKSSVVNVKGVVNYFNGKPQIKAHNIEPAKESEYNLEDLLNYCPGYRESLLQYIQDKISEIADEDVFFITDALFTEHVELYKTEPAAIGHHHSELGGMLVHIYQVLKLSLNTLETFRPVLGEKLYKETKVYVVAGAILHDIGKFYEYSKTSLGYYDGYVKRGALLGHLYLGAEMIREKGKVFNVDEDKVNQLAHIAASHHTEREFGAIVVPATRAAAIVAFADGCSAKLQNFFVNFDKEEDDVSKSRSVYGGSFVN